MMHKSSQDHAAHVAGKPDAASGATRPPDYVMRLSQLGSFFPTRLSFLRVLLRDLAAQAGNGCWAVWDMDANGHGYGVLSITLDDHVFSLIAYTAPLDPEHRTDRVIAEAWDACFLLFDGVPTAEDVAALRAPTLVQEAGRFDERVLVLSRANKSMRLFEHVVDSLVQGGQPDAERVGATGYLMRTTAVYGNGKFGIADRSRVARNAALSRPFRLEMLTVYLIREFTFALAEHVASSRVGVARTLSALTKRMLGIGNSTGLGMAPFLVNHPALLHAWINAREEALARVIALEKASAQTLAQWPGLLERAEQYLAGWQIPDLDEQARIDRLSSDFAMAKEDFLTAAGGSRPWFAVLDRAQSVSVDLEELLVALVLEPHGALIDDLADAMSVGRPAAIDSAQTLGELSALLDEHYGWCDGPAFASSGAMTWYVSEEKLEPRFGVDGPHFEPQHRMPLDTARQVVALRAAVAELAPDTKVAALLCGNPEHRRIIQRVQMVAMHPYGEIRDDLVSHRTRPIDMLRCKLSFFGADGFDPKSDRWTRVRLFAGAPCLAELSVVTADDGFLHPSCSTVVRSTAEPVPA